MDNQLLVLIRVLVSFILSQSTACTPNFYVPVENIAVDCGLIIGDQVHGDMVGERFWLADDHINTKNVTLLEEPSNTVKSKPSTASKPPPQGDSQVPYLTARVSHSQFTYSFLQVSPGQKFIRLHFYPTDTYPGFEAYPALFSVCTSNFTLLNNFTGSPSNSSTKSDVFFREFLVNVGDYMNLSVTFTPSSMIDRAYAFVNGIELLSMPTGLYYPEEPLYLVDAPGGSQYSVTNGTALELMFRINVGGTEIPPEEDTGMFRNWDSDQAYADNILFLGATAVDGNNTVTLKFTSNAKNYTAPAQVYSTVQGMGHNVTNNERNNLTWQFPVDSGFMYLVRLHFCQLSDYADIQDMVFSIYVATFLAEGRADVVYWSGGVGIPLYRDYLVAFGNLEGAQETTKVNLSIQLHPAVEYTRYKDAMLNGVEIFKASNFDGDLAGTQFYLPQSDPNSSISIKGPGHNSLHHLPITKYAIIGGAGFGLILCLLMVASIIRFWKLNASTNSKQNHNFRPSSGACRCFSLSEIKAATSNFDQESIIGHGGFGNVYKGIIDNGATAVAIKRLKQGSDQGANEFRMEIEMLSQLRYLHLVSLIGYCDTNNEMILVYDYMSRGTLRDHLYNTVNPPIPWERRMQICIGTARGLHYLHSGVKRMIIHRDIKTTNILLDEKWVAKVSDFGLSKVGPSSSSITHVSTMIKGSFGYLDPEYYHLQHLTQKSDVYSFGVVLCEVLSARPAIIRSDVDNPVSLAMWFRSSYQSGSLHEIIDPFLVGKIKPECLRKYTELAFQCIAECGVNRPLMSDVVWGLELALQLQDAAAKEQVVEMEPRSSDEEEESESEEELAVCEDEAEDERASSGSMEVFHRNALGPCLLPVQLHRFYTRMFHLCKKL